MSGQGLMSDFNEVWCQSWEGDNERAMFKNFMKSPEIQADMGLATATSFLSVGAGLGEFEEVIIGLCPNLKKATLIDCDEEHHRVLKEKFQNLPNIEVTVINGLFESYEAPSEGFDLVFMSHVFYYFPDTEKQFARALAMIKKGGKFVSILTKRGLLDFAIDKVVGSDLVNLFSERLAVCVSKCGLTYKEKHMGFECDFSEAGEDALVSFFSVAANKPLTLEKAEKIMKELEKEFKPNTKTFPMEDSFYIIDKE